LWVDDGTGVLLVRWRPRRRRQQEQEPQASLLGQFVDVVGRIVLLPSPLQQQQPQALVMIRALEAEAVFAPRDANAEAAGLLAAVQRYGDIYLRPPLPPPATASPLAPIRAAPKPYVPLAAAAAADSSSGPSRPPSRPSSAPGAGTAQAPPAPAPAASPAAAAGGMVGDDAVLRCVVGGAGSGGVGMGQLLGQLSGELGLAGTDAGAWAALAAGVNAALSRLQVEGLVYVREGRFFPL
jgi:hypothetical protein